MLLKYSFFAIATVRDRLRRREEQRAFWIARSGLRGLPDRLFSDIGFSRGEIEHASLVRRESNLP